MTLLSVPSWGSSLLQEELFAKYKQQTATFVVVEHGSVVKTETIKYYVTSEDMVLADIPNIPELTTSTYIGAYSSSYFASKTNLNTERVLDNVNVEVYLRYADEATITVIATGFEKENERIKEINNKKEHRLVLTKKI